MSTVRIRGEDYWVEEGPVDVVIPEYNILVKSTVLNDGVTFWSNVNIYGAVIEANVKVGAFVEIRSGVKIGRNTKIEPFVFIPEGVVIGSCVFIGPGVMFTNDPYPRACDECGEQITEYEIVPTKVEDGARIGAGSVIKCGVVIGKDCLIGVGSVVVDDLPANSVVYGEKAVIRRYLYES